MFTNFIIMSICLYVPTVFLDGHSRRTMHRVRMSRTAAVRALRARASRTHSPLRPTGTDLLRDPGSLSSVSALRTSLPPFLPKNIAGDEVTQQVEICGDPVDPFPIVDIPFAASTVSTFRLPLCIRMTDAEKNFWRGKSANSPLPSK